MSSLELAALFFSAMIAGVMNAVAGGGTLVTFPTLLYFGTPPIVANATNTLVLLIGTVGSVYGYRRHLGMVKLWLGRFVPVSIAGGLIGSALLSFTTDRTFSKLVPFLILIATVLFLTQGFFRRLAISEAAASQEAGHPSVKWAVAFQFAVAIYGGYFGAGIGILMLASLGFLGLTDIHEMNALKTVLGALINLVSALWFIGAGLIHWPKAGIMTLGALIGYYLGSHYSQRIPQTQVRRIVTLIGFLISAVTFYKEFLR